MRSNAKQQVTNKKKKDKKGRKYTLLQLKSAVKSLKKSCKKSKFEDKNTGIKIFCLGFNNNDWFELQFKGQLVNGQ